MGNMSQEYTLDISWSSVMKVFVAIFIFYIIYLSKTIVFWFFFGLAIAILLEPGIMFLRRLKVPKVAAIVAVYLSIFALLGLLIWISAPIFIYEIKQFSKSLPDYFIQVNPYLKSLGINVAGSFNGFMDVLVNNLQDSSSGLLRSLIVFFGGLSSTIFILTIAFFLSLEDRGPEKFLALIAPRKYEHQLVRLFATVQEKVAGWFGARILACLFVGVASFIVFYLFSIKYGFILSLLAGFLNFIPFIGPALTALLLVMIVGVSAKSLMTVLYVIIAFVLIQQVEGMILTPLLMQRTIAVPPVLVLISLLVGTTIFGFLGALFSVPVFGIIYEFGKEILQNRKEGGGMAG